MNLSELKNTLTITDGRIHSVPQIKSNLESKLNALKARTDVSENVIAFKTISILAGPGHNEANPILLRIYKEGNITIDKQKDSLKISWIVKLDTLYALAASIAFLSLLITSFATLFVFSFIISIAVFLATVFIGVIFILGAMNDLVLSCVYKS